jgi:acyl carrier protein/GNAT superfamily N-acetyltransferase
MQIVPSYEALQKQVTEIRSLRLGFITNFFPDPIKHGLWISKGDCYTEHVNNTLFVIKVNPSFWNVFFCSVSKDALVSDLEAFLAKHAHKSISFDLVGRDSQCQPLVELFQEKGCRVLVSLVRMTRMTEPMAISRDDSVRHASENDLPLISRYLHHYFDERTEQIPYDEELLDHCRQNHVLVCNENGRIAGFLIFDSNASTLYLRYWFTHPDYRNQRVGSRLLRTFLDEGKDTKRQLLWVIRTNENALVRYRHYGFAEENMFDYVMYYESQNNCTEMKEQIIKILTELRPEFDFSQEGVDFIEEGMLDSFDLITLVTELDKSFDISIDGIDILPENFCSVEAIAALLVKNGAK